MYDYLKARMRADSSCHCDLIPQPSSLKVPLMNDGLQMYSLQPYVSRVESCLTCFQYQDRSEQGWQYAWCRSWWTRTFQQSFAVPGKSAQISCSWLWMISSGHRLSARAPTERCAVHLGSFGDDSGMSPNIHRPQKERVSRALHEGAFCYLTGQTSFSWIMHDQGDLQHTGLDMCQNGPRASNIPNLLYQYDADAGCRISLACAECSCNLMWWQSCSHNQHRCLRQCSRCCTEMTFESHAMWRLSALQHLYLAYQNFLDLRSSSFLAFSSPKSDRSCN